MPLINLGVFFFFLAFIACVSRPSVFFVLCPQVKNEGRALFLNAVCMKCLDGKDADRKLCCRFCATQWDGSSLIMGTMYAYDVFAAMPCCNERLKVCTRSKMFILCDYNESLQTILLNNIVLLRWLSKINFCL